MIACYYRCVHALVISVKVNLISGLLLYVALNLLICYACLPSQAPFKIAKPPPLLLRLLLLRAASIVIFTIFYIVQILIFDPICFVQAMPPVRRPRAAYPTTRAAKKSRPTRQLPEADNPPERTSTPNSGMINLNLEALSASISAAVQQAVQNAVTSTSTSLDSPSLCQKPWCPRLSSTRCPL